MVSMLQPAQVNAAARFSKFKTCEECVAAGLGWSEAKKKCGGYATKTCRSVPSPKQKKKKKTKNSIKQSAHLEQRSVPEDDNSDIVLKDILARMKEGSLNIVRSVATSKAGACDPWEKGVCAGSRAQLRVKVVDMDLQGTENVLGRVELQSYAASLMFRKASS